MLRLTAALPIVALMALAARAVAQPSPQLEELNALWADISDEDRADLVLVPALAAMDAPPAAARTVVDAAMILPGDPEWGSALAWAGAQPQQDALDAFKSITERRTRYTFAQPYGRAAGDEAVRAGLYVDLGEPELIANAQSGWIAGLERLGALAQIEATRLASEGAGADGADLVLRWIRLARMFADRETFAEKRAALRWMRFGAERLRDLAYLYPDSIDELEMRQLIRSLNDREIMLDRVLLPRAERLAAQELLAITFVERGGPNPETFGPTMARMQSRGRPLRLFAQAARWRQIGQQHGDFFATRDRIEAVFNDWRLRWSLDPRDVVNESPTDYDRLDRGRYMLIATVVPDLGELFDERFALRVELGGTRLALAVRGYRTATGAWPEPIFAVRPRFIPEIPVDPWDPEEKEPYGYIIPMHDGPTDERATPTPHTLRVVSEADAGEGPAMPTPQEIAAWMSRGGPFPTSSQMLSQIARSIPDSVTPQLQRRARQQLLRALTQSGGVSGEIPWWVRRLAEADPNDPRSDDEIVADAALRIQFAPAFKAALLRLAEQESPTLDEIRTGIANVVLGLLASGSASVSAAGGLFGVPSFERVYDDSEFILYSRGPDETDNRAAAVGPGGDDILIWPPLFSLVREQAGG
ncbi:MAG: hypothetical protein D6693_07005 [Planctomycetota bacterium]|nr:MAG: hypothetical protein D6693_07005 [Planctomycetota bacterium]